MIRVLTALEVERLNHSDEINSDILLGDVVQQLIEESNAGGGGGGGGGGQIYPKTLNLQTVDGENQIVFEVLEAFTLTSIGLKSVNTVTGQDTIIDINFDLENAGDPKDASIFDVTQANRPKILVGQKNGVSGLPDTVALTAGMLIGISVDQSGTISGPITISFNGAVT